MRVEVKENASINKLLEELEASPQKRGAAVTRSFKEGIQSFYERILGSYDDGGIPVWSGEGKSSFMMLAFQYDININTDSDPSLPWVRGWKGPSRNKVNDMSVAQNDEFWSGKNGRWNWTLEIMTPPWLEENETGGGSPTQAQVTRPWGIFEAARREAVTEINTLVQRRLDASVRAARGSTNG